MESFPLHTLGFQELIVGYVSCLNHFRLDSEQQAVSSLPRFNCFIAAHLKGESFMKGPLDLAQQFGIISKVKLLCLVEQDEIELFR
jgi:hypothetical protein